METWKKAILLILVAVAALFVGTSLFAIVLPGGHIGTITAGKTTTFNLDTCVFADKYEVKNGQMWFVVTDLSETQIIYTSEKKSVNLQPGQCDTFAYLIAGTTTASWSPGEYKLIVEAKGADGLDLPLEGSVNDPRYTAEGGVAWQFTVLEGQGTPEPPPEEPPEEPETPQLDLGLLVIASIIILVLLAIILVLLAIIILALIKRKR